MKPDHNERMNQLVEELNHHAYLYYTLDRPEISDREYDRLYDELVELEQQTGQALPSSPTQRVGDSLLSGFAEHQHVQALWSLDKAQNEAGLTNWLNRANRLIAEYNRTHSDQPLPEPTFVVELKFDGLTLNLTYKQGQLVQAATRGNGRVGESILAQVKTIRSIPMQIEFTEGTLEIQGEGIMNLSTLEEYNQTAAEPLKNARNAAAGALRNLDPRMTAERKLDAFIYNVGYADKLTFQDHREMVEFLRKNRFKVNPYIHFMNTIEEVMEKVHEVDRMRHELDYLIDGVVIKIADMRTREALGYTDKFPRWAIVIYSYLTYVAYVVMCNYRACFHYMYSK